MTHERNRRILSALLSLLLLLGAGGLVFLKTRHGTEQTVRIAEQKGTSSAPIETPSNQVVRRAVSPTLTAGEKFRAAVESENVPVEFWGKVVDQDDQPLAAVNVRARVRRSEAVGSREVTSRFVAKSAVSDPDGRFEISGDTGGVLTVDTLEKDGYEPEPVALRSFGYNTSTNLTPDPQNPVVFRMWRQDIREPHLFTGDKFFAIIPDGRVYTVDLLKGALTESPEAKGDLKISVKRPADVSLGQRYNWSFGIKPVAGGIIEEADGYSSMYLAPADGYGEQYHFNTDASARSWGNRIRKRFYLKLRGGKMYGRIDVDVFAFYDLDKKDGTFGVKYVVNPSGSRILR